MPTLIFDCDGVLADTERNGHLPAFNRTFAEFGIPVQWTDEEYAQKVLIGGGKERMASMFREPGFTERMLPAGEGYLQLLEATGPGVVQRFTGQRGAGLHHVAFAVSSLDAAVADLRARGVRLAGEAPRPGGGGSRIAFIHPAAAHGLLIELVEPPAP